MRSFTLDQGRSLIIQHGDITKIEADAVVNAANRRMLGGMGVDGAIHLWAGPELEKACRDFPELSPDVRCPTGEARITPGFNLPSKYVIHAVGPSFESIEVSAPLLEMTYQSALVLADNHQVSSIAFPAISCGIFCFPLEEAAQIAINTCINHKGSVKEYRFVLFSQEIYLTWLGITENLHARNYCKL